MHIVIGEGREIVEQHQVLFIRALYNLMNYISPSVSYPVHECKASRTNWFRVLQSINATLVSNKNILRAKLHSVVFRYVRRPFPCCTGCVDKSNMLPRDFK